MHVGLSSDDQVTIITAHFPAYAYMQITKNCTTYVAENLMMSGPTLFWRFQATSVWMSRSNSNSVIRNTGGSRKPTVAGRLTWTISSRSSEMTPGSLWWTSHTTHPVIYLPWLSGLVLCKYARIVTYICFPTTCTTFLATTVPSHCRVLAHWWTTLFLCMGSQRHLLFPGWGWDGSVQETRTSWDPWKTSRATPPIAALGPVRF